jgi:hypothetical protein
MTSGGPAKEGPSANQLWIHGRLLDMNANDGNGEKGVAPGDWVLVRLAPSGEETVLAKNVLAYDLATDGTIATSDGQGVFIHRHGKREKVGDLRLTEAVKWL